MDICIFFRSWPHQGFVYTNVKLSAEFITYWEKLNEKPFGLKNTENYGRDIYLYN